MPSRGYLIPAIILWIASTGWLFSTKILPTLNSGNPPDYDEILPNRATTLEPVRWAIRWNGRDIGWAENRISRSMDGTGKVVSEVNFEQLPVSELMTDLLGVIGRFAKPMLGEDLGPMDLRVLTNFDFDNYGALHHFTTTVDVGSVRELLQLQGRVDGDALQLVANIEGSPNHKQEVFRKTLRVPADALVADTFSPRPRLANLRVGQKWTFQSYRPLMPHSPLELIEATVDREELVEWQGKLYEAKVVAYRRDAGSGLSAARKPMSLVWVKNDGTVIRQDMTLANVRVQFIRRPAEPTQGVSSQ